MMKTRPTAYRRGIHERGEYLRVRERSFTGSYPQAPQICPGLKSKPHSGQTLSGGRGIPWGTSPRCGAVVRVAGTIIVVGACTGLHPRV
jgi:hypothetical protein